MAPTGNVPSSCAESYVEFLCHFSETIDNANPHYTINGRRISEYTDGVDPPLESKEGTTVRLRLLLQSSFDNATVVCTAGGISSVPAVIHVQG